MEVVHAQRPNLGSGREREREREGGVSRVTGTARTWTCHGLGEPQNTPRNPNLVQGAGGRGVEVVWDIVHALQSRFQFQALVVPPTGSGGKLRPGPGDLGVPFLFYFPNAHASTVPAPALVQHVDRSARTLCCEVGVRWAGLCAGLAGV